MIRVKRVYDPVDSSDDAHFLVERLWPRGIKKVALKTEGWLKDVAPSHELRRWFGHDPAKWDEFRRRYFAELKGNPRAWQPILEAAKRGNVTLVYSAREEEYNNAMALKEYLERKLAGN